MTTHDLIARLKKAAVKALDCGLATDDSVLLMQAWRMIETLQRERDEAVAHANRWKWARTVLISMRFMSGRHMSSETSICPCLDDDITSEYWDGVADMQMAAISTLTKPADRETS